MYKATQNLSTENLEMNVKIQFVIYHIDQSMPIPFLRIYLVKDCQSPTEDIEQSIESYIKENEYLTFPSIDFKAKEHYLFNLYCQGVVESLFHEEREYIKSIQHKGYLLNEEEQTAYYFFELTPTTTESEYMTKETFIIPVLMDEILHKNCVCNVPIHSIVTSFFMSNPNFIYLSNVDNTETEVLVYEMPVVVYSPVIGKYSKAQFHSVFGISRTDGNYVFYSYNRALSILKDDTTSNKKWLLRLSLYTGNTTIDKEEFENTEDIQTFYYGYEYQTKEYYQQKPLSYHSVSNNNNYNLIL
jgi:hypothetical protein